MFSTAEYRNIEEKQKLAMFINYIGIKLQLPKDCISTAIVYIQRFLNNSNEPSISFRLYQAALLLSCKIHRVDCSSKDIYHCATTMIECKTDHCWKETTEFHLNEIRRHEEKLLKAFNFNCIVHHPDDKIVEIMNKIKEHVTSNEKMNNVEKEKQISKLNQIQYIASFVAHQSILLTPFCVKYSCDLVACFSIQMALEIKETEINEPWFQWINGSITQKRIKIVTNEFYEIYHRSKDNYKEDIYELKMKLNGKASHYIHIEKLKENVASLVIDVTQNVSLSSSTTIKNNVETPIGSFSNSFIQTPSVPVKTNENNKRCLDSPSETNQMEKRLSLSKE